VPTLSRRYGGGPLTSHTSDVPFAAEGLASEVVNVRRWFNRQKRRMDWLGVMAVARLHGACVADVWPLLAFIRDVQLGKGTSFGFGSVALTAIGAEVE
jgi:hypothetical protein